MMTFRIGEADSTRRHRAEANAEFAGLSLMR